MGACVIFSAGISAGLAVGTMFSVGFSNLCCGGKHIPATGKYTSVPEKYITGTEKICPRYQKNMPPLSACRWLADDFASILSAGIAVLQFLMLTDWRLWRYFLWRYLP